MPIRDLKAQIARLPEQPGVYLYYNEAGDTLYVGKARVLRDRVRSYLGAYGLSPRIDALLDEAHRLETIVTDSVVEALALENNLIKQRSPKYNILLRDDKTYPVPAAHVGEAFPARAGGAAGRARRALLRRPVHAGIARAEGDVAEPQAVRHPVVQRDDHRRAGAAVPRVRHQALRRALCARDLLARASTGSRSSTRSCSSKDATTSWWTTLRERMTEAAGRGAVRAGGAAARRAQDHRDAADAAAEDGEPGVRRPRRVRPEARAGRRRGAGVSDAPRPRGRTHRARDRSRRARQPGVRGDAERGREWSPMRRRAGAGPAI